MRMPILLVALFLVGCVNSGLSTMPTPSEDMMSKPCQFQAAEKDSDADLNADVQNMDCGRRLRLQVYQLQDWVKNVTTPL